VFAYLPGLLHLAPSHHIDNPVPMEGFLHLYTQCQITYPRKQSPFRDKPALQYATTCSLRTPFTHPLLDTRLLLMSRLGIPLYRSTFSLRRSISSPLMMTHGYTCLCWTTGTFDRKRGSSTPRLRSNHYYLVTLSLIFNLHAHRNDRQEMPVLQSSKIVLGNAASK
jgi:hypothetical protein